MVEKTVTQQKNTVSNVFRKILQTRELSLVVLLAFIVIALMSSTSTFATSGNIRVLLQGMSVDMMIAIPMAISLIAGNIDPTSAFPAQSSAFHSMLASQLGWRS